MVTKENIESYKSMIRMFEEAIEREPNNERVDIWEGKKHMLEMFLKDLGEKSKGYL